MTASFDVDHLKTWEGREETVEDTISPALVAAFRATLDDDPPTAGSGETAPPGLHWCLAPVTAPTGGLGPDGHPARGGFLPPVPLPRRMWAGGRLSFLDELRVGDAVTRHSTVKSVSTKAGRTGPLVFVLVEHRVLTEGRLALVEEQDIVYRGLDVGAGEAPGAAPASEPAGPDALIRTVVPSPVLLFRYSALTFNGHRIHYDRSYATGVEGYPGLIVHGPLQATLLMRLAAERLGRSLGRFAFRAVRPLFDLEPFTISAEGEADETALRVRNDAGQVTMEASAWLR